MFNLRNTFLIISALLTFFIVITNHRISLQEDLIFEIKKGNSLQVVANELKKRDIILNHFFFILNAKIYNIDQKIKAGDSFILPASERNVPIDFTANSESKIIRITMPDQ